MVYTHILVFFFFNDTATTEIYTLSLHDALPISWRSRRRTRRRRPLPLPTPVCRGDRSLALRSHLLDEESRGHRNQLWVPNECVGKDPTQRALARGDRVRAARQRVEELVIQVLERPLEPVILEVIVPQQRHPLGVVRRQPARAGVPGPDGRGGDAAGEPPRLRSEERRVGKE